MDWHEWHHRYGAPDSSLARRLRVVQDQIRAALDDAPPGPLRAISLCAGQGRDLLGVLGEHQRRDDVCARLVELNADNAALAQRSATAGGLGRVQIVVGDAALTDHYAGMAPADLVLVCGVFGNISDRDVARTIAFCGQLCAVGASLVWTRHRRPPDLVPRICQWFAEQGFRRQWLSAPGAGFGVGVHRYVGQLQPLALGQRMFAFIDDDARTGVERPI